jgi:phage gp46-like protein
MIQLIYKPTVQACDLGRNGKNLIDDPTLATAVLISLFTRRLAAADDPLPDPKGSREGWWADTFADVPGDLIGSRLWLLGRSKTLDNTLALAKTYAEEALEWMIEDGIASSVTCTVERQGELMAFQVTIVKPVSPTTQWSAKWLANLALL